MGIGAIRLGYGSPGYVRRLILAILVAANALVLALSAYSLYQSRQQHELRAEILAQSMTQAVDYSVSHSIEKIDLALQVVADELRHEFADRRSIDVPRIGAMLARFQQRVPELDAIRISDSRGRVILGKGVDPREGASWADRDYFIHLRDHPDAGLQVSPPRMGRVAKKLIVGFARRYNHPDGSFAGVIAATVALEYFTDLLSRFKAGPNASIVLRDADLGLIARYPAVKGPAGEVGHRGVSRELKELVRSGVTEATYFTQSTSDQMERTVTVRRIKQAPMLVFVGVAKVDYLAGWYEEARKTAAGVLVFVLLSLVSGWVALRLQTRIVRESARNELYLHHASDGIHILDEQGRLLQASERFCAMLGYERGEMIGMALECWDADGATAEALRNIFLLAANGQASTTFESRHRRKDGSLMDVEVTVARFDMEGKRCLFASSRDIREKKCHQAELERMAHYDLLTGLPNRALLAERMAQALPQARRAGSLVAVCYLDLDGFKAINDELGHDAGDLLLIEVGRRLKETLRAGDTVARLGGDEFVLLLIGVEGRQECERAAGRILEAIAAPIRIRDWERSVSASLGIAIFPDNADDSDTLLRHADQAMYQAKQSGKNRHVVFEASSGTVTAAPERAAA